MSGVMLEARCSWVSSIMEIIIKHQEDLKKRKLGAYKSSQRIYNSL